MMTQAAPTANGSADAPPDAAAPDLARLQIDRMTTHRRRGRVVRWIVVLLILIVLGALSAGPIQERLLRPRVRAGVVTRVAATAGVLRTTASGYVVARTRAAISSRQAGRLEALHVDVGSRVVKGQLLGQLGHDDLAAGVEEWRATVAQRTHDVTVIDAEIAAAEAAIAAEELRVTEADAAVEAAQERLTEAERLLQLEGELEQKGASSDDATARARAERDVIDRQAAMMTRAAATARTRVEQRRRELDVTTARRAAAESAIDAAKAALARAEALRADADILAPFAGVVVQKEAEVGEMVAPVNAAGSTTRGAIVTLADFKTLEMEVDVIERDIGMVSDGLPCRIVLDSRRGTPYAGRVRQVVPTADRSRGIVQVKVTFDALDEHVLPEMSGRVEFLSEEGADAVLGEDRILAPAAAIVTRDGQSGVFVIEDAVARFVPVTTGETVNTGETAPAGDTEGDRVVVASGVTGGEQVVLSPGPKVVDGATVELMSEATD